MYPHIMAKCDYLKKKINLRISPHRWAPTSAGEE